MRILSVFVISVLFACEPAAPSPDALIDQKNLVVIVVDTLRADHLGYNGYARKTSPFLDSLASKSVVFDRAYSASAFTRESIAALLTGRLPSLSGSAGWNAAPSSELPSLGTSYQAAGYRTGFFTSTIMLGNQRFTKGFSDVDQLVSKGGMSGTSHKLTARTLQFIKACQGQPFMAYVHYFDPHGPYNPPKKLQSRFTDRIYPKPVGLYSDLRPEVPEYVKRGFGPGNPAFEDMLIRYDAELLDTDRAIGQLFKGLRELGLADDTLAVVTADHGEEFLDHGFVEHAWTLYEESIHVPLLICAPGSLAPARVTTPVSLVDLVPTVTMLQGVSRAGYPTDGQPLFSQALLPIVTKRPVISELLIHHRNVVRSVVFGDEKLIQARRWLTPAERSLVAQNERQHELDAMAEPIDVWGPVVNEEFFDLAADALEQHELSGDGRASLEELRELLSELEQQAISIDPKQQGSSDEQAIDEETQKLIEGIGYTAGKQEQN